MAFTRRSFLRTAAAAGTAFVLPSCSSQKPRGKKRPDEKLKIGIIGVGGRGADNLAGVRGEDIVALCDIDRQRLLHAAKDFPSARTFVDFRELIEMPMLDAVVISTPDHTHYPASMLALHKRLDVYCEKPLTHTVTQARCLQIRTEQVGAITQMGTQIHATENYRRVVEAIQGGVIGDVEQVHVYVGGTDWSGAGLPAKEAVPEHVQWDLWLGPAKHRDYSSAYHPAGWRRYWAFGGGTTADMACHFTDLPFWALDLDAPVELRADGPEPDSEGAPRSLVCDYLYPARGSRKAVRLRWACGDLVPSAELEARGLQKWKNGVLFLGSKGWLISNYDSHEIGPKEAFAGYVPPPKSIPKSVGHHLEWIAACKERTLPSCHFGYAAPLTEAVLLANVAYRGARGKVLTFEREQLVLRGGGTLVQDLLDEPLRVGWDG
ncbi:MAG: Gfo/Idh/MocA family oxidoreductase [Planctomycetota bacterium]